jgi:DNA-directed RNA polymerase subunit RPC12/RpoP
MKNNKERTMLITCSECGHKVSDKADKCPSCGIGINVQKKQTLKETVEGVTGLIIIGAVIFYFATGSGDKDKSSTGDIEPLPPDWTACSTDWKACKNTEELLVFNNAMREEIIASCRSAVISKYAYQVNWGGEYAEPFSKYMKDDLHENGGIVRINDNVATYKDASGNPVTASWTKCEYDLNQMAVSKIEIIQ